MVLDYSLEYGPDILVLLLAALGDHPLHALGGHLHAFVAHLGEAGDDEGLEQLESHGLGQAALVELQFGTDDDDAPAGVVDALAEEVLAEAAALALQEVGEAAERPHAGALHGLPARAVVQNGIDSLLEHPLLVPENHLGRLQVEQAAQPVVPVDHPAVEIVQVAGGEPSAVQRNQRPEIGRQDGEYPEDHPFGLVVVAGEPE